jgi:hypothetical protein
MHKQIKELQDETELLLRSVRVMSDMVTKLNEVVINLDSRLAWVETYLERHGDTDQPPPQV